jgi:tRNA(adenine34) deaminase
MMRPAPDACERWMREALRLAREAQAADEAPVGAVVVRGDAIIGAGRDRRIEWTDPTAHAEILALREAAARAGDWRLEDCALVTTLEPCPMCAGAALLARVPLLVYGASNAKFGAVETHMQLLDYDKWNHEVDVIGGVLAEECGRILSDFFSRKRSRKSL